MYITICEIDDQCKLVHAAGHSKPVLWDNPEERDGEGFQERHIDIPMADSC